MNTRSAIAPVTVLLPTFNRANYIEAAIKSLLWQRPAPLEILVIDDGSNDATREVCGAFGDQIRVIAQELNQGKTAAINRGLLEARGNFIWVMDDDDIAPEGALAALLSAFADQPRLGYSFGRLRKFVETEDASITFLQDPQPPPPDCRPLLVRLMEDCFITGQPCVLIRKSCFDTIGPFDPGVQVSVDYNILLEVARRYPGQEVDAVVLWQRQHAGARGPVEVQYRVEQRVQKWMASDARIIQRFLADLALPEYLGRPASDVLTKAESRVALFQKSAIAGRKHLWDAAIAAVAEARGVDPDSSLSDHERDILFQMLGCRYGVDPFLADPEIAPRLAQAAGRGSLGDAIREAIAARLPSAMRAAKDSGNWRGVLQALRAIHQMAGWRSVGVVARRLANRVSNSSTREPRP